MPHSFRRITAHVATTVAATALLTASVGGVATAQSSDDSAGQQATTQHDNLTVTHEIIGSNVGLLGDAIHYRTTISATDGPARQVTGIDETILDSSCNSGWTTAISGTVTHTNQAGDRVTENMPAFSGGAVGSWTVAPDSTVVYDSVHTLVDANQGFLGGCQGGPSTSPEDMGANLVVKADGLDTLTWSPTGVTLTCAFDCTVPGLGGLALGSVGFAGVILGAW